MVLNQTSFLISPTSTKWTNLLSAETLTRFRTLTNRQDSNSPKSTASQALKEKKIWPSRRWSLLRSFRNSTLKLSLRCTTSSLRKIERRFLGLMYCTEVHSALSSITTLRSTSVLCNFRRSAGFPLTVHRLSRKTIGLTLSKLIACSRWTLLPGKMKRDGASFHMSSTIALLQRCFPRMSQIAEQSAWTRLDSTSPKSKLYLWW